MRVEWRNEPCEVREIGAGPILVLVHGYPLDGAMWSPVARRLSAGFRVLKPDLPGRPDNASVADGSIDSYADFVQAVVEAARAPVGLAGFSMGGYVALALMKRSPRAVKALALVDTRAVADDDATRAKRDETIATLRDRGVAPIAEAMLGRLLAPASLARRDLPDRVARIMLRQSPAALESDLAAMRDRPDSTAFLSRILVPALVVVGEQDAISPPAECEAMARAIPDGRFVTINDAGHLAPMENPAAVAQALEDFFVKSLGARPPAPTANPANPMT